MAPARLQRPPRTRNVLEYYADFFRKKKHMRILNVICSADPKGGGPIEWVRLFGTAAVKDGHQVEVTSLDSPGDSWISEFPLPVHALGRQASYYYSRALVPWLRAHASAYDCVIVHGLWRYVSLGTWRALRSSSTPYFVYTHGMLDPWFKHTYPWKHLGKWLYWPLTDYLVLRDAAGVIFTCEQERLKASRSFRLYRAREMVATLGIGLPDHDVDRTREIFFSRFPELKGTRFLLFLGRIHPKKGCDVLIEALASVAQEQPDLNIVFAGPDQNNWIPTLDALAATRSVQDRIVWAGMLSGDAKWGAFHSADAFVLSSHQENFGIAVVEAMACGLPVLISDKVDIWKEIENDNAGLVSDDSVSGTAAMLRKWANLSDETKAEMRTSAARSFKTNFEVSHATRELLAKLDSAMASTNRDR